MLIKLVKGQAVNTVGIDKHLIRSPLQSSTFRVGHPGISTDDEEAKESNVTVAEISGKPVRLLEIVERIKPVNQLAKAMVESPPPFFRGLVSYSSKETA